MSRCAEPSPASVMRASSASTRRQLAGRRPACRISRTASAPAANESNRTTAASRCSGRSQHPHPRLGDHRQRPLRAEQHPVGRRARAGARQPPRLPHVAADGQRAHGLDEVVDVRRPAREVAARARRDPAAERRELERLRVEAQRQPLRAELLLEPRAGRAGLDPRRARDAVDLEHAVEPRRLTATTPACPGPGRASTPPTTLVPPPNGTTATSRSPHQSSTARSSSSEPGVGDAVGRVRELARASRARRPGTSARPRARRATTCRSRTASPAAAAAARRRPAAPAPPAPSRSPGARRARPRARLVRDGLLVLEAPSPVLAAPSLYSHWTQCPTHPASSPAAPGRRIRWRAAGARRSTSRPPPAARPPTRRSPRSRTAARPRTTGSPPGSPATRRATAGSSSSCSRCAGRCGWCARTPAPRWRRCA